jgi:hypothetical protein
MTESEYALQDRLYNQMDTLHVEIIKLKKILTERDARIADLERQLAATRPAPHMAILQGGQHDRMWA